MSKAAKQFKPSAKHLAIFKTIQDKGYYKPAYSDQEPATKTIERLGIVRWRDDMRGVIFTEYGKQLIETNNW